MGNQRFKILTQLNINYYEVDIPIEIDKGVILLDTVTNQTLLQLKLRNISNESIKFVDVEVECFDLTGNPVSNKHTVLFTYQDFLCLPKGFFGERQAIKLAGANTRQVNVNFKRIMFKDGNVLSFNKVEKFKIPPTISYDSLDSELKKEIEVPIKNLPKAIDERDWICSCGRVNIDRAYCVRCGNSKRKQFDELSLSRLRQLATERKEKQDQLKKEKEEQAKLNREKIKRILKHPILIGGLGTLVGFSILLSVLYLIETSKSVEYRQDLISSYEEQIEIALSEGNEKEYKKLENLIEKQIKLCGLSGHKCTSIYNDWSYEYALELYEKLYGNE